MLCKPMDSSRREDLLCKTNGFRPGGRTCCASQWISSRREDLLCKPMDFVP
jgi:hypothetical protein